MVESQAVDYTVQGQSFHFQIYEKSEKLGVVPIRHLWMNISSLYPTRKRPSIDALQLAECYWALCLEAQSRGEPEHPEDRQTYLLARLLPATFTNLAAKVMPDRGFGPTSQPLIAMTKKALPKLLEELLRSPSSEPTGIIKFRDQTSGYLEMPEMDDEVNALYRDEIHLLLDDAAKLMPNDREAAARLAMNRWNSAKFRHIPRKHWKSPVAQRVFSVISYECRAALHDCYSDVWTDLLGPDGPLRQLYNLSPADLCFLSLWHVIQKAPSDRPDARFDLFHGHIFALHPALRLLIQTATGRKLLGNFVTEASALSPLPEPEAMFARVRELSTFRRLLQAADLAVYIYTHGRAELASSRAVVKPTSPEQLELHHRKRHERKLGRSRRRPLR